MSVPVVYNSAKRKTLSRLENEPDRSDEKVKFRGRMIPSDKAGHVATVENAVQLIARALASPLRMRFNNEMFSSAKIRIWYYWWKTVGHAFVDLSQRVHQLHLFAIN